MMRAFAMLLTIVLSSCASPPETPEMRFLRDIDQLARTPMNEMRPAVETWLGLPLETDSVRPTSARRVLDTPVFAGAVSVDTGFPPPASPGARYAVGALSFDVARPCVTPDSVRAAFGGRRRLVAFGNYFGPRAYEVAEGAFGFVVSRQAKRVIIFAFDGRRCADGIRVVEGNTADFSWVVEALSERSE